jgi:hypothetical protein
VLSDNDLHQHVLTKDARRVLSKIGGGLASPIHSSVIIAYALQNETNARAIVIE